MVVRRSIEDDHISLKVEFLFPSIMLGVAGDVACITSKILDSF